MRNSMFKAIGTALTKADLPKNLRKVDIVYDDTANVFEVTAAILKNGTVWKRSLQIPLHAFTEVSIPINYIVNKLMEDLKEVEMEE